MSSNEQAKASKEKAREIKVWVDEKILDTDMDKYVNYNVNTGKHKIIGTIEATLLIKEPEKTVTISETEFHQMTRDFDNPKAVGAFRFWYEKLFGKEG